MNDTLGIYFSNVVGEPYNRFRVFRLAERNNLPTSDDQDNLPTDD